MKLPKLYHGDDITTNNKKTYYSIKDEPKIVKESTKIVKDDIKIKSFTPYFNKNITIYLKDGNVINGRILSKIDKRILVTGGIYLNVDDIESIN